MNKEEWIRSIIKRPYSIELSKSSEAYAPSNIALVKYWGKRQGELNLPNTSSLSISLADYGVNTELAVTDSGQDVIRLNGELLDSGSQFARRASQFLNLFRIQSCGFEVKTSSRLPVAAGLASSAAGFAALTLSLNKLFGWGLSLKELSMIARLGSGSAARSLWQGFVVWHRGEDDETGSDSYAEPIPFIWPELRVGLVIADRAEKSIPSREAMNHTVKTSPFYPLWPAVVDRDLILLRDAMNKKDMQLFGEIVESNAMAMHATMLSARPSLCYFTSNTLAAMNEVYALRKKGVLVYFTEDAGPNLKLLFLSHDEDKVKQHFPTVEVVNPWKI